MYSVAAFADVLLAADLPDLPQERRQQAVAFVSHRTQQLPSFTRAGLVLVAAIYRSLLAVPRGRRLAVFVASKPIPLLSDYPRLVRSLGYAFVWERWPDTAPSGAPRQALPC